MDTDDFYRRLGTRIRALRRAEPGRITQEDVARRLGLNRTTVVNIEKGRQRVAAHQLVELADALGCEPAHLLSDFTGNDPADGDDTTTAFVTRIRAKTTAPTPRRRR